MRGAFLLIDTSQVATRPRALLKFRLGSIPPPTPDDPVDPIDIGAILPTFAGPR